MRQPIKGIINTILDARFTYLFFTIILLFLLRPFIESTTAIRYLILVMEKREGKIWLLKNTHRWI